MSVAQPDSFSIYNMTAKVQGSFAAGFEPVKEALEKLLNSGCEDKVQLCVYVGKDCVLDLYGSFGSNDSTYNSDTIQVLVRSNGLKARRGALNRWIMMSFCKEMALLAETERF